MTAKRAWTRRSLLAGGTVAVGGAAIAALVIDPSYTDGCTYGQPPAVSPSAGASQALANLSDIAVGEAVLSRDNSCGAIIVARPTDTTVVAYSAICPHKGVVVALEGGQARCPAHDALFDPLTGAVRRGPADKPLAPVPVTVVDGSVTRG